MKAVPWNARNAVAQWKSSDIDTKSIRGSSVPLNANLRGRPQTNVGRTTTNMTA
jgi:hypothetical protein